MDSPPHRRHHSPSYRRSRSRSRSRHRPSKWSDAPSKFTSSPKHSSLPNTNTNSHSNKQRPQASNIFQSSLFTSSSLGDTTKIKKKYIFLKLKE